MPSSGSADGSMELLKAIEETLRDGRIPEWVGTSTDGEVWERLKAILAEIVATQQFALSMAQGDLSQSLAVKGVMAGSLKSLQSSLRHLTWQAGQIASGDLTQRVRFMGEFSASFNAMVDSLTEDRINRIRRQEELKTLNTALANEIAERKLIEEKIRLQSQIFETIGEGINLIRAGDGVIVFTNSKFDRMFGYEQGS